MARFLFSLIPLGVLVMVWDVPPMTDWRFWVGAVALAIYAAI